MGVRRKGRELALQMLYQWDVTRAPFGEVIWSIGAIRNPSEEARDFGRFLAEGTIRRVEEIDTLIAAQSRQLETLADGGRGSQHSQSSGLRVSRYRNPKRVIINEALEITKAFPCPTRSVS